MYNHKQLDWFSTPVSHTTFRTLLKSKKMRRSNSANFCSLVSLSCLTIILQSVSSWLATSDPVQFRFYGPFLPCFDFFFISFFFLFFCFFFFSALSISSVPFSSTFLQSRLLPLDLPPLLPQPSPSFPFPAPPPSSNNPTA